MDYPHNRCHHYHLPPTAGSGEVPGVAPAGSVAAGSVGMLCPPTAGSVVCRNTCLIMSGTAADLQLYETKPFRQRYVSAQRSGRTTHLLMSPGSPWRRWCPVESHRCVGVHRNQSGCLRKCRRSGTLSFKLAATGVRHPIYGSHPAST